ncbi:MAG: NADH-quinone oxidoreductase subunit N [Myxococcota bacterium]
MITIPALGDSLLLTTPVILLFGVGLLIMLIEAWTRPANKMIFWVLGVGGLLGAGALTAMVYGMTEGGVDAYAGMLRIDRYGVFFSACSILAGLLSLFMSDTYLERIGVRVGEYYALVLFGVMGMMLMSFSNDLMMVFIALEVMSIAMYVLCALKRGDPKSVESGFKYFILGSFSSGILLYGVSFLYGAVGSTSLDALSAWLQSGHDAGANTLVAVGMALVVVGFGFKVASVPFHMWTPDVYQGAPTSVTALMSAGVKAASFAAFGRVVLGTLGGDATGWQGVLWWMAALTMIVGNLGALVQDDLKRILAYSSIAHAGYLLMAFVSVGPGGVAASTSLGALLFYMLAYTFMNAGSFAVLSMFTKNGGDDTRIENLSGFGHSHPWLAAGLSICLLSLAGIPPTMGFVGKFYLFSAALEAGQRNLAIIGAVSAAAGVYYYIRPMIYMYMRPGHPAVTVDRRAAFAVALCAVVMIALGLVPSGIMDWAADSMLAVAE